jgi:hypothetical protein
VRENGILGLYRGLSTLLVGSVPKSAVRFGGYEFISGYMKDKDGKMTAGRTFVSEYMNHDDVILYMFCRCSLSTILCVLCSGDFCFLNTYYMKSTEATQIEFKTRI